MDSEILATGNRSALRAGSVGMRGSVLLLLSILTACNGGSDTATPSHSVESDKDAGRDVHWGYSGETSPENWADLSSEFSACRDGNEQSPIDQTAATRVQESGFPDDWVRLL
jgi:carbonic anhydrase